MYGFGGVGLSDVQISISELSVVGGGWWVGGEWVVGGLDKRTSWSDLHRVRQKSKLFLESQIIFYSSFNAVELGPRVKSMF